MTSSDPEVARLAKLVADLDGQVRKLAGQLLTSKPAQAKSEAEAEELVSWLTCTDRAEAEAVLEQLRVWLEQVYLRYPKTELPDCWAWHPDVVEELWWLRNAWCEAYAGDKPSWQKAGDWHDRYRPGVVARVTAATLGCGLDVHVREIPEEPPGVPFADVLPEISRSWASAHRVEWPPRPTDDQLAEARRRFDAATERRRNRY